MTTKLLYAADFALLLQTRMLSIKRLIEDWGHEEDVSCSASCPLAWVGRNQPASDLIILVQGVWAPLW